MPFRIIRQVFFRGEWKTQSTDVPGEVLRIGRGLSSDLRLEDLLVSLNHATIGRDEARGYVLRDVTATGDTFLNRAPVKESVLRPGDTIRIQQYGVAVSLDEETGVLALTVQEEAKATVKPGLALLPKLRLAGGRWSQARIALALCLLVAVGTLMAFVVGPRAVLMPGEVSVKHAKFSNQCEVCHASAKPVWKVVENAACQTCHEPQVLSPAHFAEKVSLTPAPLCAACHLEHKGRRVLADVPDQKCGLCHGDLKASNPHVPGLPAIHSFATDHPEFAITRSSPDKPGPLRVRLDDKALLKDESTLDLNHQRHLELSADFLQKEFGGTEARRMVCVDCHRTESDGRTMLPIRYERDCQRCHSAELEFDLEMPGQRVLHGRQVEDVRRQLEEIYAGLYMKAHPEEARKLGGTRWIPGRPLPAQPQTGQERYVIDRLPAAESLLFSKNGRHCLKCHQIEAVTPVQQTEGMGDNLAVLGQGNVRTEGSRPEAGRSLDKLAGADQTGAPMIRIRKVASPSQSHARGWLPYTRFDHQAHASLPQLETKGAGLRLDSMKVGTTDSKHPNWCVACHDQALRSTKTEDVLLPSISLCRECHHPAGGAQSSCKSCHDFHVPDMPAMDVAVTSGRTAP